MSFRVQYRNRIWQFRVQVVITNDKIDAFIRAVQHKPLFLRLLHHNPAHDERYVIVRQSIPL
jgi:uncharacterized protein YpiB (UPF0302 family)